MIGSLLASSQPGGQSSESGLHALAAGGLHLAEQDEAAELGTVNPVRSAEQRERRQAPPAPCSRPFRHLQTTQFTRVRWTGIRPAQLG